MRYGKTIVLRDPYTMDKRYWFFLKRAEAVA